MEINTAYYGAPSDYVLVSNDVKRTKYFSELASDNILIPDNPIDQSIFLNAVIGDTLCVPRFAKLERSSSGDTWIRIVDSSAKRSEINNYFLTNSYSTPGAEPTLWDYYSTQKRIGMDCTSSNIPDSIAPITECSSKYLMLLIMVHFRLVDGMTEDSGYKYFSFSGYGEKTFAEFTADETLMQALEDGYLIVDYMYAKPYYGTHNLRSYNNKISPACSYGNLTFKIPDGMTDSSTTDHNLDRKMLMPKDMLGCSTGECLKQGGGYTVYLGSTNRNCIWTCSFANPSFWSIGGASWSSSSVWCFAYIDSILKLRSAMWAYCCTPFYFCESVTSAETADLDNPDNLPDDVHRGFVDPETGLTSPDPVQQDPTSSTGLTDDPTKLTSDSGFAGNNIYIDLNDYVDETPLEKPAISTLGAFNRTYAMNYSNIQALADWLWNASDSVFDEIVAGLALLGERPIEGIIDVRLYPFNVASLLGASAAVSIKVGRTGSSVLGLPVSTTDNAIIDLGSCYFNEKFNSFLDYAPYTDARLYIPYCGVIPIDVTEFMGHELSAKMIVDVVTGACVVMIYKDKIICAYASGTCGVSIPFTGSDSAGYASQVLGSFLGGAIDTAAGIDTGNGMQLMEGLGELRQGFITPVQYVTGGTSSPSCANWQPQYAYIIIDRPVSIAPANYGHAVGFACERSGALSSFSGFTVVHDPDLTGITATDTEKEQIRQLLTEGVYL